MKKIGFLIMCVALLLVASGLAQQNGFAEPRNDEMTGGDTTKIPGFSFLRKIVGQWQGPVFSSTPAGSSDCWHVDFRPVSAAQVSQYTSIDTSALNYTSFFIVRHDEKLKIAMRTEGVFNNKGCVTYEVMDSLNEETAYYRFSDFKAGVKRAYTIFRFREEGFVMEVFTTKFNSVARPVLHSRWETKLAGREAAQAAIRQFNFPQAVMVKDFSSCFLNRPESIYYTFENDPYPSSPQPYVGTLTVDLSTEDALTARGEGEIYVLLTTQPLFDGIKYLRERLNFSARFMTLPAGSHHITFQNVHPGLYYVYSFMDRDGDRKHLSGDLMSSKTDNIIVVKPEENAAVRSMIDIIIP